MNKKGLRNLSVITIILAVSLLAVRGVQAENQDSNTGNMREMIERRDTEGKEYKQRTLSNSEEGLRLLREIRDLLRQLNEKEQ